MAFKVYHSDGVTPVDAANPLECSHGTPGEVLFVCEGAEEATASEVTLFEAGSAELPSGLECSLDAGATWGRSPNLGIITAIPVPVLIRPIAALRYTQVETLGDGRFACVPKTDVTVNYGGMASTDPTTPVATGTLTVLGGNNTLLLSGVAATDNIAVVDWDVEYKLHAGSTWTTLAHTAYGASFPNTVTIADLINESVYDVRVRARDEAGNTSPWLETDSIVPSPDSFVADFAAGTSLASVSAFLDTSTAGGGMVASDGTKCSIVSGSTAAAAMLRFVRPMDRTKRRRVRIKMQVVAGSTASPAACIPFPRVCCAAAAPVVGPVASENPNLLVHQMDRGNLHFVPFHFRTGGIQFFYNKTAGTWGSAQNAAGEYVGALSTYYYGVLEWDSAGFIIELRDASDALLYRSNKVAWSLSYTSANVAVDSANPARIFIGDPYTDYWTMSIDIASVKVEALPADIA